MVSDVGFVLKNKDNLKLVVERKNKIKIKIMFVLLDESNTQPVLSMGRKCWSFRATST